MAQVGSRGAGRARRTARRYGLIGWGAAAAALCVVLVAVVLVGAVARGAGSLTVERSDGTQRAGEGVEGDGAPEEPPPSEEDEKDVVIVHVDGAVGVPGVYELEAGARVGEAVDAAGGLADDADTSTLNLAAEVADGEKVYVPHEGEAAPAEGGEEATGGAAALVNINTAGVEELDELPGVGEATARAIVEDRETNGPFSTPEDLMRVSGIGEKKFARLEGLICV